MKSNIYNLINHRYPFASRMFIRYDDALRYARENMWHPADYSIIEVAIAAR